MSEVRLIDANALLKSMHDYWGENPSTLRMVNEAPTIDAVEVVRCGECIFIDRQPCPARDCHTGNTKNCIAHCSIGERRESEGV